MKPHVNKVAWVTVGPAIGVPIVFGNHVGPIAEEGGPATLFVVVLFLLLAVIAGLHILCLWLASAFGLRTPLLISSLGWLSTTWLFACTPDAPYAILYSANGKVQDAEVWLIPTLTLALGVGNVLIWCGAFMRSKAGSNNQIQPIAGKPGSG